MRFLNSLFNRNKIDCPRCLGKGDVDLEDIKRLKNELYWIPGICAYCNGAGKVSSKKALMVSADIEYLTIDLPNEERKKLLNGDTRALQRAKEHVAAVNKLVKQIQHQYYIENQEAEQIADYLFRKYPRLENSSTERQETIKFIEKVIESKPSNK